MAAEYAGDNRLRVDKGPRHAPLADAGVAINDGRLKNANESAWAQFKAQMEKTGGEVKTAVERMTTHLKQ
ncbi:MAG: hypothetical protein NVS1B6_03840 [Steroidobacteraceae bacterium]